MIWCPGEDCKKRETCKHHFTEGIAQVIDWSSYGTFRAWLDKDGNYKSESTWDCGDKGNYQKYEEK